MRTISNFCMLTFMLLMVSACQPAQDQQSQAANGMVLHGANEGKEFLIATGNEDEIFMEVVDAFNRMDIDALWEVSADTIIFHGVDGTVGPLTKSDMSGMFSSMDSVRWSVDAVIPVQVEGSQQVNILADGTEWIFPKEGESSHRKLFERFVFEDGVIVEVHQWAAGGIVDE